MVRWLDGECMGELAGWVDIWIAGREIDWRVGGWITGWIDGWIGG